MRGPEWGLEGTASVPVQVCWGVVDWTPGFPLPEPGPDGTVRRRSPPPGRGGDVEDAGCAGRMQSRAARGRSV